MFQRTALLAALLAGPLVAQSDSAKLVVLNRGYVDAFMHGDSAWYNAHVTPEFECLCGDGSVVNRRDFLIGNAAPMTYKSFLLDSVRVKLQGDVAAITAITPWVAADGRTGVSRYTDIWVRRRGEWKTLQAQITPIRGR